MKRFAPALLAAAVAVVVVAPRAHAQECTLDSHVVGHNDCGEFGRWDAQNTARTVFGLGTSLRTLGLARMNFDGTADHTLLTQNYRIHGSIFHQPTAVAYTADVRFAWYFWRSLYLGAEMGIGGTGLPNVGTAPADNGLVVQPGGLFFFDVAALIGVSLPLGSVVMLRAEALFGGRTTWLGTTTTFNGEQLDGTAANADWLVEPRGAIEFWLEPHTTLGLAAGGDAWPHLNFYGGLFLQWHTRAFDGLHDRWSGS